MTCETYKYWLLVIFLWLYIMLQPLFCLFVAILTDSTSNRLQRFLQSLWVIRSCFVLLCLAWKVTQGILVVYPLDHGFLILLRGIYHGDPPPPTMRHGNCDMGSPYYQRGRESCHMRNLSSYSLPFIKLKSLKMCLAEGLAVKVSSGPPWLS